MHSPLVEFIQQGTYVKRNSLSSRQFARVIYFFFNHSGGMSRYLYDFSYRKSFNKKKKKFRAGIGPVGVKVGSWNDSGGSYNTCLTRKTASLFLKAVRNKNTHFCPISLGKECWKFSSSIKNVCIYRSVCFSHSDILVACVCNDLSLAVNDW